MYLNLNIPILTEDVDNMYLTILESISKTTGKTYCLYKYNTCISYAQCYETFHVQIIASI